jgi:RNA polymerase sigma factor (sigma-70 family)
MQLMRMGGDVEPVGAGVDRASFGDFYRLELDGQVRRAVLLLGSNDIANDVVHDAFIAVYDRWDTLEDPGPYLHTTVLNRCRGIHRQRSRQRRLLPRLVDRSATAPLDEPLDDVLGQLPFNQRAAVVLRFYGGLSTEEIAEELGCAPGSVGPWITRALAKLRKALQ